MLLILLKKILALIVLIKKWLLQRGKQEGVYDESESRFYTATVGAKPVRGHGLD